MSILATALTAPVTPHHTPPEPYYCPEYCGHNCIDPQWPDKAPEQEVYFDMHPVLNSEDDQYRQAAERGDHPTAESLTCLFRLLFFALLTHHASP
jgi:hypothetical protein